MYGSSQTKKQLLFRNRRFSISLCVIGFVMLGFSSGFYLGILMTTVSSISHVDGLQDEETIPLDSDRENETKRITTWNNWPATAYEAPGYRLVTKGISFFHQARELLFEKKTSNDKLLIDEFLEVYKNRPDTVNLCGIRINHALALYLAIKEIKPTLVVESGVNAGQSTYFIRAASPTTRIFAIDPLDTPICKQLDRWVDKSELTTNYTGRKNFKDLLEFDWSIMIEKKEIDPERTLVFIDDHLHTVNRINRLVAMGIKHFLVEDNYKNGEGKLVIF